LNIPVRIVVSEERDVLTVKFSSSKCFELPSEYLRVFSPSAEVRGHGKGQEVLQYAKRTVSISSLVQAGNYAIQIFFSDGHDSGIYSWDYLHDLGVIYTDNWINYLSRLHEAGKSRDSDVQVVKLL
jgi:DUF971 family protein